MNISHMLVAFTTRIIPATPAASCSPHSVSASALTCWNVDRADCQCPCRSRTQPRQGRTGAASRGGSMYPSPSSILMASCIPHETNTHTKVTQHAV